MKKLAQHFVIAGRQIGPTSPCYIIAEIGVNHNGDINLAKKLIDAGISAGVDAVKFQKRKLSHLYQEDLLKDNKRGEQGLQYLLPMLAEFELTDEEFCEIAQYARERGIVFLCTPWDCPSVDFLESLNLPAYKIGSPDMTNFPLIEYVLRTKKPILMSTGMSSEDEIRRTLEFLKERDAQCGLFHCISTYPAPAEQINLRFMQVLHEWTGWPVGYSGHDVGIAISLAAVAMGACMLERHLTLDHTMRGPDHAASLEPDMFKEQVRAIREVEASMGVPHRWMTRGEVLNRRVLSKSLVASQDIAAGSVITPSMVLSKSPGLGLSPQFIGDLIGKTIQRNLRKDEIFIESDVHAKNSSRVTKHIDVGTPWGIIARFHDLGGLLQEFNERGMSHVEFHVSDRDLDHGIQGFNAEHYPFELVVHAPEYFREELIDFCSADAGQRQRSVQRIQQTIDLTRQLKPWFKDTPRGPKIVFHIGGMSRHGRNYDLEAANERVATCVRQLDLNGVDLLLENLPPHPWYFGGRWYGHVLVDADNTVKLCEETKLGLCFDTSHAGLACNHTGDSLLEFSRRIQPYVRHLHVSDAAGTSGEGLQIGDGQINFFEILPILTKTKPSMVPEIWMGHHEEGRGFQIALERLTEIAWASNVDGRTSPNTATPTLGSLVVPASADILDTLRVIDANGFGIAFVVDEQNVVLGVVTDGDIRHGIVQGKSRNSPVIDIVNRKFTFGTQEMTDEELRANLPGRTRIMPILDKQRKLIGVASERFIIR